MAIELLNPNPPVVSTLPDLTVVPKQPVIVPSLPLTPPSGYYIFAYKLKKENNGKNRFVVTDHTNIERFITDNLHFGIDTQDIKVVEKADDYLEAHAIADALTIEESQNVMKRGGEVGNTSTYLKFKRIINARYTLKEIFSNIMVKRYDI